MQHYMSVTMQAFALLIMSMPFGGALSAVSTAIELESHGFVSRAGASAGSGSLLRSEVPEERYELSDASVSQVEEASGRTNAELLAENAALHAELEQLRRKVDYLEHEVTYRCPKIAGPFPLKEFGWGNQSRCVGEDLEYLYTMNGQVQFGFTGAEQEESKARHASWRKMKDTSNQHLDEDQRHAPMHSKIDCLITGDSQLGGGVFGCDQMMRSTQSGAAFWSKDLVNNLLDQVELGRDISPETYWHAAPDIAKALDIAQVPGKEVLVGGSISPWIEALALNASAGSVFTIDYNPPETDHPRINPLSMADVLNPTSQRKFDVIVSFSSIEHDGLGRYGDPLNPIGDFASVREYRKMLRPGGLFLLGVPISFEDELPYNSCRIYGPLRLPELIKPFEYEGYVYKGEHTPGTSLPDLKSDFWQHNKFNEHNVMILRRPLHEDTTVSVPPPETFWGESLVQSDSEPAKKRPVAGWVRRTDKELAVELAAMQGQLPQGRS